VSRAGETNPPMTADAYCTAAEALHLASHIVGTHPYGHDVLDYDPDQGLRDLEREAPEFAATYNAAASEARSAALEVHPPLGAHQILRLAAEAGRKALLGK
jgi:hypothetical protein